jgi:dienelactone hydrolase
MKLKRFFAVAVIFFYLITACTAQGNRTGSTTGDRESGDYAYTTETLYCNNNGKRIFGIMYRPQRAAAKIPATILCHGYGVTHANVTQYAEALAKKGIAAYCFDFCGGSESSRSDGSPRDMSVLTEQRDLESVFAMIQKLDYVDNERIFLQGSSMGGVIAAITGADHKDEIRGMILVYPALKPMEDIARMYKNAEQIPESTQHLWMRVGRRFFADVMNFDVYNYITRYDKDVLIIHGDRDGIVPLAGSQQAIKVYPSAELKIIRGAGHGFSGNAAQQAIEYMLEYIIRRCS